MRPAQLGWVIAAGIAGVCLGGGFQTKTDKTGFVDMQGLYENSNLKTKNDGKLRNLQQSRQATLDFLNLFPAFSADQLVQYKTLSTKDQLTPAETTELAKLKADVQAATKQYDDLRQKPNPTAQELARLNDLGARNDLDRKARQDWGGEFSEELSKAQGDLSTSALDAIKAAIAQVAKPQGYTLVFRENIAVYGKSDLATEVKKIVDKNAK